MERIRAYREFVNSAKWDTSKAAQVGLMFEDLLREAEEMLAEQDRNVFLAQRVASLESVCVELSARLAALEGKP